MHPRVLSAVSLILIAAAPAVAGARLEVLPGHVGARPGDRIRLTAIAWIGPADKPVATLPPAVEWSTSAGQIDGSGLLMIPTQAPATITVRARVGALHATASLRIRRTDLLVLPAEVRVLSGKALRFTVLDFSGGHVRTPDEISYSAERGVVSSSGRYRAPDSGGPDTLTVRVGERVSKAQILVVSSPGVSSPSPVGEGPEATPDPAPAAPAKPAPSAVPWKITNWSSSGGFGSKTHKVKLTVYDPRAVQLKAYVRKVGGKETITSSRGVKAGESYTLTFSLSMTSTAARIVLYDGEGKVIASRTRSK